MKYFRTSEAALAVGYVFSLSSLGYVILAKDLSASLFLTLWGCALAALAIALAANKVEARAHLEKLKNQVSMKMNKIEQKDL